jgi:ribonuclease G
VSLELVIDVSENEVQLALLKDKKLIELQNEQETAGFSVGDVYLGKVGKSFLV